MLYQHKVTGGLVEKISQHGDGVYMVMNANDEVDYIHEDDLIPRRYNSGMEDLDLIVERLEELGIEASHGDYMDVS